MRLWKSKDRKNYIELSTRVEDMERKMKVLELDLELYVKKLKASRGLTKEKPETEDIKKPVLLNPDGTFLSEEKK